MQECCSKCKFQCDPTFKFCPKCGEALHKRCDTCNKSFSHMFNFCPECGLVLKAGPPQLPSKPTRELQDELIRKESDLKVKVGILSGHAMTTIKLESGGGQRHCFINSKDDYYGAFRKISELYFPKRYNQCLGHLKDFKASLLDFKKQVLNEESFRSLAEYLDKAGLQLNLKPILFLHIKKEIPKKPTVAAQTTTVPKTTNVNVTAPIPLRPPVPTTTKYCLNNKTLGRANSYTSTSSGEKLTSTSAVTSVPVVSSTTATASKSEEVDVRLLQVKPGTTKVVNVSNGTKSNGSALSVRPNANINSTAAKKRDSSSDSSVSSSSSRHSWANAKKLDKNLNNRISEMKNQNGNGIYPDTERAKKSTFGSTETLSSQSTGGGGSSSQSQPSESRREPLLDAPSSDARLKDDETIKNIKKEKFDYYDKDERESFDHRHSRKSADSDYTSYNDYRRYDRGGDSRNERSYSQAYSNRFYDQNYNSQQRTGYHPYKNYYHSNRYQPGYRFNRNRNWNPRNHDDRE